jgi:outer membrane protein TolC
LGLKWNIFDNGIRNKRIQALEIERVKMAFDKELLSQQISLEINNTISSINSIYTRISAEEQALKSAKRSMDLIKIRYENDKALLIELLQAQNKWQSAKLARSLSKIDLLIHLADLERITAQ